MKIVIPGHLEECVNDPNCKCSEMIREGIYSLLVPGTRRTWDKNINPQIVKAAPLSKSPTYIMVNVQF